MAESPVDGFADLDDPTVPCERCGEPIPLMSFRLPPKLCDRCCESPSQSPKPAKKKAGKK